MHSPLAPGRLRDLREANEGEWYPERHILSSRTSSNIKVGWRREAGTKERSLVLLMFTPTIRTIPSLVETDESVRSWSAAIVSCQSKNRGDES